MIRQRALQIRPEADHRLIEEEPGLLTRQAGASKLRDRQAAVAFADTAADHGRCSKSRFVETVVGGFDDARASRGSRRGVTGKRPQVTVFVAGAQNGEPTVRNGRTRKPQRGVECRALMDGHPGAPEVPMPGQRLAPALQPVGERGEFQTPGRIA